VRTADGHLVAIPNKTVGNAIVTNIASRPQIRTVLNVGISGDTPSDKVKRAVEILEEVFRNNPLTREVLVTFNKLADSALNIQVVHLWSGTDGKQHLQDLYQATLEIKDRFGKEGIQLAFPTQTVSVKREGRWVPQPPG
jgi:MscS family membrane protein